MQVALKAYAWVRALGAEGLREVSEVAVLNNNYLLNKITKIRGASAPFATGRRRIEPHGNEWRQACEDLGIAGETAHHRLPFPRSTMQRNHAYQCPACGIVVGRVRPFKRATACLVCCRKHSGGAFDARFKFMKVRVQPQAE